MTRHAILSNLSAHAALAACALVFATGCPQPPTKALDDAAAALLAASARKDCAQEKYAGASKLLDEARALNEAGKYDEAERKALAAKKLAEQAKTEADASWEECNRRDEAVAKVKQADPDPPKNDAPPATLSVVYFAYDSSELTPEQRQLLDQNALWMRQNKDKKVLLEGHTDERGSIEYNLALGERRASSARQYLEQLGVDSSRLDILSYGEEKPAAFGQSPDDYRQNRRVEFIPGE